MVINMQKLLEDMGWSDGFFLPVANKENLELEAEVEKLTAKKIKLAFTEEALIQKCDALDKHLKNVTGEQEENQKILFSRQSQLDAEKNLYLLAKKEKEHLTSDMKTLNKQYEKINGRKEAKIKELNTMVEKLDKLKASIEWEEQTINNWEDMLAKKSEDNEIILKYAKEDRMKAKELEVKRLHLQEEEHSRKQLVIRTSKELDSLELILTRNVQHYKQLHEDRSNLLKQWQDAVKQLQQRDADTLRIRREIINIKELNVTKLENLEEEKQFHTNELNNNSEMEAKIEQTNAEITAARKDISRIDATMRAYYVEYDALKRELQKTNEMLHKERVLLKKLNEEHMQKGIALEDLFKKVLELKEQEKNVRDSNTSSSERCKTLEQIIKTEEMNATALFADIENMQSTIFRSQQILSKLLDYNKLKTVELRGTEEAINTLDKKKEQIEKQLLAQQENNYKVNYRIALLNSKLTRLIGADSESLNDSVEDTINENKLADLELKCTEVLQLSSMLQTEQLRMEDFMRQLSTLITTDTVKIASMKDTLQNQKLLVEGAVKRVAENKNLQQQHQVDENVLKVRLNHAEKSLKTEGKHIYNLQRQQLELESMVKEREADIQLAKDMLIAKRNALDVDNTKLRNSVQACHLKSDTLKKKLDTILSTIGKTDDGEEISAAYFKIKQSQEKSMLQVEGDQLDKQIRQAEKEIIAMENTLKTVNICNESFKKSLTVLNEEDEEIAELAATQQELCNQTKLVRKLRSEYIQQQEKVCGIQKDLEIYAEKIEKLKNAMLEKKENLVLLENEAVHRRNKIERTQRITDKLISRNIFPEELVRDFMSHELQSINLTALGHLREIGRTYIDTHEKINKYLLKQNLSISGVTSSKSSTSSRSCSSVSYYTTSSSEHNLPRINLGMK